MKLVSSNERYRCEIFWVTEDRAVDRSGFEFRRAVVRHRGSAVMMPVDRRGRILLVRQYRLPARKQMWELPAGRLDEGENVLRAAKRELAEESGLRAKRWQKLISFYASPGYVAEKMTIFVATGLIEGEAKPMEDERIECRWFTSKEILGMIRDGSLSDAKSILGFLVWRDLRRRKRSG